jgi:predicted metal-dependent peptidase
MLKMATRRRGPAQPNPATVAWEAGRALVCTHPLFPRLLSRAYIYRDYRDERMIQYRWIEITERGHTRAHPTRRAEPEEWAYVLAHGLLHLGFGHLGNGMGKERRAWTAACCLVVSRFMAGLKLFRPVADLMFEVEDAPRTEEALYAYFLERGVPVDAALCMPDGLPEPPPPSARGRLRPPDWERLFAAGLADAVRNAVQEVSDQGRAASGKADTPARRARAWLISSYPLLAAMAARFEIVEDPAVCARLDIGVAAVCEAAEEIYVNPAAGLDEEEARFVLAHELLHVGLRHADRQQGRDAHLWNVSADYVINGWLVEMGVGHLPAIGCLYDPLLKSESSESVYDRLVTDLRRGRRLQTLRGRGLGDILGKGEGPPGLDGATSLDEYCRRALLQGLSYHQDQGRGYLPAGLVEEIRALGQPPIAWDVQLARWFAERFPLLERTRSYARMSRRQSATPDIPRPALMPPVVDGLSRTFGVVLDTSGSMDRVLLAKALGAIASYSQTREVPAARVVFCDAVPYDEGYLPPEAIAGRVRVRGRGGTVLQPGIDLLERAVDFPKDGPILVITDGFCDALRIRRDHAFLIPKGRSLPFSARGPVFRVE